MCEDLTNAHVDIGHAARPATAAALWTSVAGAAAFTVFAYLTTQVHAVRAGSPWQDDPYDVVVTFTIFFVPLLGSLGAVRALLCPRDLPLPRYRVEQISRAGLACTLLVAATLATDWAAVAVQADRGLWNRGTPWLVASLLPLTAVTAAGLFLHRRAVRLLPRTPAGDGDWLDDLVPLVGMLTSHPRVRHSLISLIDRSGVLPFVRRRFTSLAAAAAVTAGLLVATGLASGEGWPGILLFTVETAVFAGGTFAFAVLCNSVLCFAAPPPAPKARRAARVAATAGASVLPISLAFRDALWQLLGLGHTVDSVWRWAVLTLAGALVTGAIAFGMAVIGAKERRRRAAP